MKQTFVFTKNGIKYILPHSLDEIEKKCSHDFFRVNRQTIVKRSAIKEVLQEDNRKMKLVITNDKHHNVLVGKLKRKQFLEWLEG